MSFAETLTAIDLSRLKERIYSVTERDVADTLAKEHLTVADFPVLIAPPAAAALEQMAAEARRITLLRFGKTIKLYAPLYISNECVNACIYCGFNVNNTMQRVTLSREDVLREAEALYCQGFR
ncbi:MAG: 2-iminoacetate synthase ThiH, partial [Deltaproteobacteria bacterium]|nr:2-iminoacetate synthase ThiH [Deltaproteobacteria bacterium]